MTPSPNLVASVLQQLDRMGVVYAIGGSFASSLWGEPRQTHDLDIGALIGLRQSLALARVLSAKFQATESEIRRAHASTDTCRSFQLLHVEETFKVDLFILSETPYVREFMSRRRSYPFGTDYSAPFLSPEDTVITKLKSFVQGERLSDRQWNDVVWVLESQWLSFDFPYALKWAAEFGVDEELGQAMAQVVLP